jgi:hypothetical protein
LGGRRQNAQTHWEGGGKTHKHKTHAHTSFETGQEQRIETAIKAREASEAKHAQELEAIASKYDQVSKELRFRV